MHFSSIFFTLALFIALSVEDNELDADFDNEGFERDEDYSNNLTVFVEEQDESSTIRTSISHGMQLIIILFKSMTCEYF